MIKKSSNSNNRANPTISASKDSLHKENVDYFPNKENLNYTWERLVAANSSSSGGLKRRRPILIKKEKKKRRRFFSNAHKEIFGLPGTLYRAIKENTIWTANHVRCKIEPRSIVMFLGIETFTDEEIKKKRQRAKMLFQDKIWYFTPESVICEYFHQSYSKIENNSSSNENNK